MLSRIRETLKPFLPGGQTEPAKRKRESEGSDIPPMPEKRLRTDDSPARKPTILLKKVATWVVNKHRSFTENYYVRQITGSPKAVMKKLSGLSNQGQGEMPANRQPFLQPGIRLDQGSDVRYGREIMSAMQGIQIHSTPVNNPAKGYSFTDANFDLDQPDVFSFVGSSNRKIQFQGDSSLQPRIQDVNASSGQELTRPPIRSQYGVTYENQVLATGKGPGYKSIYDKVFSGQGKPRRRFHGHHYRSKTAVRESIRMEERTRYAELIQQFTTAPVVNRAYNPFSAQKSVINSSKTKDNETVLGTEVTDIGPDQLSDRTQSSISSRTDSIKVHAKQMQQSKSVVGARQHLASLASGVASRDTLHPDPITIDLTEAGESSNQTAASSSSNQTLCSNSNQTASSTEAFSAENLSPRGRRKWSQSRSLSPSNSLNGFTRSIQDSKYIRDDWLQDMLEKITLESKDLKSKAEEEEIKVKYYKDKRKHWDEDLEKRIHHRLRLSERAPHVIEETFEEEEEEQAEFPELTDEQEEMVNAALVPYPPDQKIAEGFRLELTRHDIQTLNGLNWLNDEVINFYMNLLMERSERDGFPKVHAFNTFFYPKVIKSGQQSVRRWTKKVDIFSKDYILVPVHLGMHWCLAVVDFRKKEIRYYDSMGGSNKSCLEALRKYLMDESFEKKKQKFDMSDWKLINVKDVPQQMNGSDCGMFACKFAEYITRDAPITFNQEHMPYFRRRMIYEILTKQLM